MIDRDCIRNHLQIMLLLQQQR